jgi:hypothetical protein
MVFILHKALSNAIFGQSSEVEHAPNQFGQKSKIDDVVIKKEDRAWTARLGFK